MTDFKINKRGGEMEGLRGTPHLIGCQEPGLTFGLPFSAPVRLPGGCLPVCTSWRPAAFHIALSSLDLLDGVTSTQRHGLNMCADRRLIE